VLWLTTIVAALLAIGRPAIRSVHDGWRWREASRQATSIKQSRGGFIIIKGEIGADFAAQR